jgi:hypothetical protein
MLDWNDSSRKSPSLGEAPPLQFVRDHAAPAFIRSLHIFRTKR